MESERRMRRVKECFRIRELGGEGKSNWRGLGRWDGDRRRVRDDGLGESGSSIFERSGYNRTPVRAIAQIQKWRKKGGCSLRGRAHGVVNC